MKTPLFIASSPTNRATPPTIRGFEWGDVPPICGLGKKMQKFFLDHISGGGTYLWYFSWFHTWFLA